MPTENDLPALNDLLSNRSYVAGSEPSSCDTHVHREVKKFKYQEYPHIARWFVHIESFGAAAAAFPDTANAGDKASLTKVFAVQMETLSMDAELDPVKEAKKKEKEAARLDKLRKFEEKKKQQQQTAATAKPKEVKSKPVKEAKVSAVYDRPVNGEKKDISGSMPDSYSPAYVEAAWYEWWERAGFFKPEYVNKDVNAHNPRGRFMIVIPPPNVTGSLHLGHALTTAVQDTLVRWHRMRGETVLWNPGCDHAGIATQVVVEKRLWRENKQTRHDLGREAFIQEVLKWKEQKVHTIYNQLKRLGGSYDWDRAVFTMDPKMCRAVTEAFVRLHDEGTIYRSNRLVNWSCTLLSAISDIEVDKHELKGKTFMSVPGYKDKVTFGVLTSFAYKVCDATGNLIPDCEVVVATTRPETMLGDTAVAVHPDDARYTHLHGKFVSHPFVDRILPVVVDSFVEIGFGSGCVKITPAHDANDYDVGKRHSLPFITIITDSGKMTPDCGEFADMPRFTCRTKLIAKLQELGLYRGETDNPMVVPVCSRSKDIIEPLLKPQWYVSCDDMAAAAVTAVREGDLKLTPAVQAKTWYNWLEKSVDWCISRQLWWGHRVPAYFVSSSDDSIPPGSESDGHYWVSAQSEEQARLKAAKRFNTDATKVLLRQDEDVLDTWFSSGLFPFSIFGWPDNTPDLQAFYPGTLLETGYDILFFWVARMVFFGQKLMGKLPFKDVFLHPMVRDAHGRKMSKTLGNVIDPVDVICGVTLEQLHEQLAQGNLDEAEMATAREGQKSDYPNGIPECGSDALRFTLCSCLTPGLTINMDVMRIQGYRFFCNKMWNAAKFTLSALSANPDFTPGATAAPAGGDGPMELWLYSRVAYTVDTVNKAFQEYDFPTATSAIYQTFMYELCDVYLEYAKSALTGAGSVAVQHCLYTSLDVLLRLLHPVMPFITEELFQRLPQRAGAAPSIVVSQYPETENITLVRHPTLEGEVKLMQQVVGKVRQMRADYQLVKQRPALYIHCSTAEATESVKQFNDVIERLSSVGTVELVEKRPPGCATATASHDVTLYLLLKGVIDLEKETARIQAEITRLEGVASKLEKDMMKETYDRVPEKVKAANTEKLTKSRTEMEKLTEALHHLE